VRTRMQAIVAALTAAGFEIRKIIQSGLPGTPPKPTAAETVRKIAETGFGRCRRNQSAYSAVERTERGCGQ
jgi:hypothetical protein